ncbi:MAG: MotA/TolQ/ExbB proton channel family protein [Candidatus Promineifilaceae bacterium]|jgi:biopolymer transport protein ExbB/TolQ
MIDYKQNFSARMLLRLVVLSLVVAVGIFANIGFFKDLYFSHQLTSASLITNGGILTLFSLGLIKVVLSLLRYMREETALARFFNALEVDRNPLKGISPRSLVAQRYTMILAMGEKNIRINQSALAATLAADESTRTSFAKYISNILILTGVFGTCVSLSIALTGVTNLLDSAQGTGNMGLVMHGMSTALSTTITAIVSYLFFGYFYLKLNDAQVHVLSSLEEVTALYLLPRYSRDKDSTLHEVAGLVHGLRQAAEAMRATQRDYAEAGNRLHEMLSSLDLRVNSVTDDVGTIKTLLRDGFRLPAEVE